MKRHFLSAVAGKRTYTGQELVGLIIDIKVPDGRAYQLRLRSVWDGCRHNENVCDPKRKEPACNRLTFWVSPYEEVPYYDFQYRKTSDDGRARPQSGRHQIGGKPQDGNRPPAQDLRTGEARLQNGRIEDRSERKVS